jgi:hypothetical protein
LLSCIVLCISYYTLYTTKYNIKYTFNTKKSRDPGKIGLGGTKGLSGTLETGLWWV